MDNEKIGKFIRQIRLDNKLSQKEFANIFMVSTQAVSKWENGKSVPDIAILKEISEKFNVDIEEIINGEKLESHNDYNYDKKKRILVIIFSVLLIIILVLLIVIFFKDKNDDYDFKVISSNCENFKISGTLAYNSKSSSIYISNIDYCGGNDNVKYKKIECSLYEVVHKNNNILLSTAKNGINIKLEDYLQNVLFTIDKYENVCSHLNNREFYLQINATNKEDKVISYKVPLKLSSSCNIYDK